MILGVKAFTPQLTAVKGKGEYQFKPGKNVTEKARVYLKTQKRPKKC